MSPFAPAERRFSHFALNCLFACAAVAAAAAAAAFAVAPAIRAEDRLTQARAVASLLMAPGAGPGAIPLHHANPPADANPSWHRFSQYAADPAGQPDGFERQAEAAFARGAQEFLDLSENAGAALRFAIPLRKDGACPVCAADPNVRDGQLIGGVSVRLAAAPAADATSRIAAILFGAFALTAAAAIPFFNHRHHRRTIAAMETKLGTMSATDELTGLANRRQFFKRLDEETARALRHGHSLAVILIDIDHFKQVNDRHGHAAGDQALQILAELLRENCRISDPLARLGGEEFALILPEATREDTVAFAEKLRVRAAATAVHLDERTLLRFTISLGVAWASPENLATYDPPSRLVSHADAALRGAKHSGRNRVTVQ